MSLEKKQSKILGLCWMEFKPRNYQTFMIEKMVRLPAVASWARPGLGKTAMALSAIDELMINRLEIQRCLIVAPLRVAQIVWPDEIAKWDNFRHLPVSVVLGTEHKRLQALSQPASIYTINRENLKWLAELYAEKWPFDMVVLDESSAFRRQSSGRFRAMRWVRPLCKKIIQLTGTPEPRSYMDLWAQLYLLDRGERLGRTFGGFRERYFEPLAKNAGYVVAWALRPGAKKAILSKISDI